MKIELLPKGKFLLRATGEDGKDAEYRGRFSMYAIDRFCAIAGVDNYFSLIEKISAGMSLRDYATLLMCALNESRADDSGYDVKQVMYIFDDVFDGVEDPDFIRLIYHAIGRISTPAVIPAAQSANEADREDEEKKSGDLTSANLSASPLKAV